MPYKYSRSEITYGRMAFHVWNRGTNRRAIFLDDEDRAKFLEILRRHLSPVVSRDESGRKYRYLGDGVRLYAFALMPNHFHLVVEQLTVGGLESLMQSLSNAYVQYFNRRHNRRGPLFAGPYRQRVLLTPGKIRTAITYVHANHGEACDCRWCSHRIFIDPERHAPGWLAAPAALELFGGTPGYKRFRELRQELDQIL